MPAFKMRKASLGATDGQTLEIRQNSMRLPSCFVFCLITLILGVGYPGAYAMVLVKEGKPTATLVVPDAANHVERFAAEEFRYHLNLASGAELPIVIESKARDIDGPKIYFGRTDALAQVESKMSRDRVKRFSWDPNDYSWEGHQTGDQLFFWGVDGERPLIGKEAPRRSPCSRPHPSQKNPTMDWRSTNVFPGNTACF